MKFFLVTKNQGTWIIVFTRSKNGQGKTFKILTKSYLTTISKCRTTY